MKKNKSGRLSSDWYKVAGLSTAAVLLPFQISAQQHENRPNILLIVSEDNGQELSCYSDPNIETPHLDSIATEGILFENAYVTQAVCSHSRSSILTGLYPHQNGQLGLSTHKYSMYKKWETTYSVFQNAGYYTGLIGKTHINPESAVERLPCIRTKQRLSPTPLSSAFIERRTI